MLQPDKIEFLRKEVTFLGHVISERGIDPDPRTVSAVRYVPCPKTMKKVQEFLGLTRKL